jgi:hypothetical protein
VPVGTAKRLGKLWLTNPVSGLRPIDPTPDIEDDQNRRLARVVGQLGQR